MANIKTVFDIVDKTISIVHNDSFYFSYLKKGLQNLKNRPH